MSGPDASLPVVGDELASFLRSCAGCAAHLAYPHNVPFGGSVYCGKCTERNRASWADFDPQPYREVAYGERPVDQSIRRYSVGGEWCVVSRDGDSLGVRLLGWPDDVVEVIHVSDARPRADRRGV